MITKHIHYTIIALLIAIAILFGCSKHFLDVNPQGQLTEQQVLTDPDAASNMVTGVYNTLYFGDLNQNNTVGILFAFAGDMTSDNADKGSFPDDYAAGKELDGLTWTPNTTVFNDLWKGHYQGIARANQAIDKLEASSFDETVKKRLLGETKFIRALYYFNLVRMFGGVPKILRVPNATEANSDEFQVRASKEEIYQVIIEDLQYGVDNLPLKGDDGSLVGRATRGAAQSLLAKVYLYLEEYQKAFDNAKAVIESNKYQLAPDYNIIFREAGANNSESIFEVETGTVPNCNAVSRVYSNAQGPRSKGGWNDLGFGLNTPTSDLANAYEPGDVRKNATIIFINPTVTGNSAGTVLWDGYRIPSQDSVENSRYNYKAYHSPLKETLACGGASDKDNKPKNIRILRYSEVLLIYAEAAVHIGQAGEALEKLGAVRSRAGLTTSSATEMDIWKERRVELAMEADRWFDLVRTGRAGAVMRANGKPFVDGKHELFPIPQIQIDLSGGKLTQNPNY